MTQESTTNETAAATPEVGADTALGAAATTENTEAAKVEPGAEVEGGQPEAAAEATGAPDAYDTAAFSMPEGVEFDTEGFGAVEPVLRELNLSQDAAGKLMGAYAEKIVPMIEQRQAARFDEAGAELRANLARELQDDPEVGGKNLDESRSFAAKAIAHFIPNAEERSEFSTFLNESGMGNNRYLMRLVAGAGRTISEASTPSAATASAPLSESEKFYGRKG